jgi:hypothetical protein
MFNPDFSIDIIPPATKVAIITTLTNLKKPDLFVNNVVTAENIIKINDKK